MQIGGSLGQGLLCSIQMNEVRKTDPWGPESSTLYLAPRAFSTGVVDPLGWSFVWIDPLDITALKR